MVDDVVLLQARALHALAAALLAAVQVGLRPLGVAGLGDRDDDFFARDQILVGDITVRGDDAGAPVVAELLDEFLELLAHDGALALRLGQDVLEVGDLGLDLREIVDDALALEGGQPAQLHIENGLGLDVVDVEQLDQALAGRRRRSPTPGSMR